MKAESDSDPSSPTPPHLPQDICSSCFLHQNLSLSPFTCLAHMSNSACSVVLTSRESFLIAEPSPVPLVSSVLEQKTLSGHNMFFSCLKDDLINAQASVIKNSSCRWVEYLFVCSCVYHSSQHIVGTQKCLGNKHQVGLTR